MAKLYKIIIFVTFIVTLFCSLKFSSAEQMQSKFGQYSFLFDPADSLLVKKLIVKIRPQIVRLDGFLGGRSRSVITIYLTRSQTEYDNRTRNVMPEWSQAVAFSQQRLIVIRLANAEEIKTAPRTLLHELTHVHLAEILPAGRLPVWLNEGLAQYFSDKEITLNDKVSLANALAAKKIMQLDALDSLFMFYPPKARLAYIQSLSAIHFFLQEHDLEKLQQLIRNLGNHRSLNDAFRVTVGYDFIDFELNWYEDLKSKYRWLIWMNFDNLLWISMAILAILAIIAVRYRNRKKIRDWEQDEISMDELLP